MRRIIGCLALMLCATCATPYIEYEDGSWEQGEMSGCIPDQLCDED